MSSLFVELALEEIYTMTACTVGTCCSHVHHGYIDLL